MQPTKPRGHYAMVLNVLKMNGDFYLVYIVMRERFIREFIFIKTAEHAIPNFDCWLR